MNSFSLWRLFTTDVITAIASILLVIFSVLSWAIIVEKIRLFHRARRHKPTGAPDEAIRSFDKNLWFLAMVAYVSPFIGLFGTVWGLWILLRRLVQINRSALGSLHLGWRLHWEQPRLG